MKLCCVGLGYIGLVTGSCMAELGHQVYGIEKDQRKLSLLHQGISPIYEDNLEVMIQRHCQAGRMIFSKYLHEGVKSAEIIFICVDTPPDVDGSADLSKVFDVAREIGKCMDEPKVIVTKSTVPVGTNEKIRDLIQHNLKRPCQFAVVSNPEFLREGRAIADTLYPDRIVIGSDCKWGIEKLRKVYAQIDAPEVITDLRNAEMIKYAANSFLATKISFINSMAKVCESLEADVEVIAEGIGLDTRIGPDFLKAGIGYGGACLPKDTKALIQFAKDAGVDLELIRSVVKINQDQSNHFFQKVRNMFPVLDGKVFAVLGLAFKPNTDDIRFSPALVMIRYLLNAGAKVRVHDPQAMENVREKLGDQVEYGEPYVIASGADALLVITDWEEYKHLDLIRVKRLLKQPYIFDGRNIYSLDLMSQLGFEYQSMGRRSIQWQYQEEQILS